MIAFVCDGNVYASLETGRQSCYFLRRRRRRHPRRGSRCRRRQRVTIDLGATAAPVSKSSGDFALDAGESHQGYGERLRENT